MTAYSAFAGILDYPDKTLAELVAGCSRELAREDPEANAHLLLFQSAIAEESLGRLQEFYTDAFDLRPDCTPNLGYHVFGDDARRGVFLAELKGRMAAANIPLGAELPDHITYILRYLDLVEQERIPLIDDCLLPSLTKMLAVFENTNNPYGHVLRSLLSLLRHQHETAAVPAGDVSG